MTDTTAAEPTGSQTRDLSGARDMIVCEDVSKWYGDFQALDKVSATIKEQEVVVVLGPSGSGKSTWIRCINRLEIHQEGRIVVDDVELTNDLRNIEKVRSEVARALDALPGDEGTAVYLVDCQGLTYKEAAVALSCSEATVKRRLRSGRQSLAESLSHLRPGRRVEAEP